MELVHNDVLTMRICKSIIQARAKPCGFALCLLKSVADDQSAALGVVAAEPAGRQDLDACIFPDIQNAVFQRLSQCEIITMADRDISADESVLLHGADQRLHDLFCTARLAFKGDLSLITAAADAPDAESLGEHTCQTVDASVLDQVVKRGERKEDFGFL